MKLEFIEWDINKNVHRTFSFNPTEEIDNVNFLLDSLNGMAKLIISNYVKRLSKFQRFCISLI